MEGYSGWPLHHCLVLDGFGMSSLKMGRNQWFGNLCQFVFWPNRCSSRLSPASLSRYRLRGSVPAFIAPPSGHCFWVGGHCRRQGLEAQNTRLSEHEPPNQWFAPISNHHYSQVYLEVRKFSLFRLENQSQHLPPATRIQQQGAKVAG